MTRQSLLHVLPKRIGFDPATGCPMATSLWGQSQQALDSFEFQCPMAPVECTASLIRQFPVQGIDMTISTDQTFPPKYEGTQSLFLGTSLVPGSRPLHSPIGGKRKLSSIKVTTKVPKRFSGSIPALFNPMPLRRRP